MRTSKREMRNSERGERVLNIYNKNDRERRERALERERERGDKEKERELIIE